MSRHLQKDIEALKEKIIEMGESVEDRVYQATMSIINRDKAQAQAVLDFVKGLSGYGYGSLLVY